MQAVDARQHGAERLGGGPQHVHMGVVHGLRAAAGAGVDARGARHQAGGFLHAGPQQAQRADAGELGEEAAADTDLEPQGGHGHARIDAFTLEVAQRGDRRGQHQGQRLHGVGAAVVPGILDRGQHGQPGRVLGGPAHQQGLLGAQLPERPRQRAVGRPLGQRIAADRAGEGRGRRALAPRRSQQQRHGRQARAAGLHLHGREGQVDRRQRGSQVVDGRQRRAAGADIRGRGRIGIQPATARGIQHQVRRLEAAREVVGQGVGHLGGRGQGQLLGHAPGAGPGSALVRSLPRRRVEPGQAGRVGGRRHGHELEALEGAGHQGLGEGHALEQALGLGAPGVAGRDGKLGQQAVGCGGAVGHGGCLGDGRRRRQDWADGRARLDVGS